MISLDLPAKLNHRFFALFIKPHSTEIDSRRQEYILNVLLTSLAIITTLALAISTYHSTKQSVTHYASSLIGTIIFSCMVYGLLWMSRRGHHKISSYIFIILLGLTGLQLLVTYSFELPQALLICAITIVISSVLLTARIGLIFTGAIVLTELTVGYFQLTHRLLPNISWFANDYNFGDAISYGVVLGVIGVVAWLSNREIDRSLGRARRSEAALAAERDTLEIKVIERTRELEQAQLLRTMELQRFAEFGRLSANLLHELASPLTAASLNLQQLSGQEPLLVEQVQRNLEQIQRYVVSARKQLQSRSARIRFATKPELAQITDLLQPVARDSQLKLRVKQHGRYWLYGDPVKFNQLVGNLIMNAIDASKDVASASQIIVDVSANTRWVIITVTDWGTGIAAENTDRIFEPFYTTKAETNRGMGIGLAMVKDFVENEFHGTISVRSNDTTGTQFTVKLKRHS